MRTTTIFAETHTSERANHVAYRLVALGVIFHSTVRFYSCSSHSCSLFIYQTYIFTKYQQLFCFLHKKWLLLTSPALQNGVQQWRPQTMTMVATTMTATNHDDQVGEIYWLIFNEFNWSHGRHDHYLWPPWFVAIMVCDLWPSWYGPFRNYSNWQVTA